ncbi:uncharacterized protein LOC105696104 [Orussus abietinus]|uniref:uncharacterized protein LOC105696104 n=1 Tax=Orussus abietinus TaxID=222816 RepID=UPI0006259A22|nr:uncharacterized protein LOC105696104 [Orussus abietinus]XP_012273714.1 uncharacterized protein LOC105696104 [Orussus abietinus]
MEFSFTQRIENLRRRGDILFEESRENLKNINDAEQVINLNDISRSQDVLLNIGSDVWQMRNDSSGVKGVLCPDYFWASPTYRSASAPDMTSVGRVLIASTKRHSRSILFRRPVKECYCCYDTRKVHGRSSKPKHIPQTQNNHFSCCCDVPIEVNNQTNSKCIGKNELRLDNGDYVSPPISCETYRRVQKINYTPRSYFLRNVQSKVTSLHSDSCRLHSDTCLRTLCQSINKPELVTDRYTAGCLLSEDSLERTLNEKSQESKSVICDTLKPCKRDRKEISTSKHCIFGNKDTKITSEKEPSSKHSTWASRNTKVYWQREVPTRGTVTNKELSSDKSSTVKPLAKKTIVSKKSLTDEENSLKKKKSVCLSDIDQSYCCCRLHKGQKHCPKEADRIHTCDRCCRDRYKNHIPDEGEEPQDGFEKVKELNKFREQNYFDTHGSNYTLLDPRSSGSLQCYELNDRLFPEFSGKVHRDDLVVTIPPCATKQRKRIHYFPRSIIKQEKDVYVEGYKKKRRFHSCPLTGHAIDMKELKVPHPSDSLALKYQKGVP